jgi:hypothetical protein
MGRRRIGQASREIGGEWWSLTVACFRHGQEAQGMGMSVMEVGAPFHSVGRQEMGWSSELRPSGGGYLHDAGYR